MLYPGWGNLVAWKRNTCFDLNWYICWPEKKFGLCWQKASCKQLLTEIRWTEKCPDAIWSIDLISAKWIRRKSYAVGMEKLRGVTLVRRDWKSKSIAFLRGKSSLGHRRLNRKIKIVWGSRVDALQIIRNYPFGKLVDRLSKLAAITDGRLMKTFILLRVMCFICIVHGVSFVSTLL